MNLKELQVALTHEQRIHMEHLYHHIKKSALMGIKELTFGGVNVRVYNDISSLTEDESNILRQDGYTVSWNRYTELYTVAGW